MAQLYFELISRSSQADKKWDCGNETINQYVYDSYFPALAQHAYAYNIYTYNKKGIEVSLGYIQILFRDVELDYFPSDISDIDPCIKETGLPAIHIRYLAIDKKYQHKAIGTQALNTMIKKIQELSKEWPICMITIDSRQELVKWYEKVGFRVMKKNWPGQDGYNVGMFYKCINKEEELYNYMTSFYR